MQISFGEKLKKTKEKGMSMVLLLVLISLILLPSYTRGAINQEARDIGMLEQVGVIKAEFPNEDDSYFWNIDDICCDDENKLYIADSGWNKIFVYDRQGNYTLSIGREGQGPGEFMGNDSTPLRISFGNDGNLYVVDPGNARISVISKGGVFLRQHILPPLVSDSALVNSDGDIYLLTNDIKKNIINVYDKDFKLIDTTMGMKDHFNYPFFERKSRVTKFVNDMEVLKFLTKNNNLITFSNLAITAFVYNRENKLKNKFAVDNAFFLEDFKARLSAMVKKGGFIVPFKAALDKQNKVLLLFYSNSSTESEELYRYGLDGTFINIHRFPEKTDRIYCTDGLGNIYAVARGLSIKKYTIPN